MSVISNTLNLMLLLVCAVMGEETDESEGGAFLFLSTNEEFSEDESQLLGKGKGSKLQCQDETLQSFLTSVQVINPESVIALATKNKLEKSCVNLSKTIDQMQTYLKSCSLQPQQETYNHLLKGVVVLHKKICTNDPYHKSFMEFKKCFVQLQSEFDSCNGPADWSGNSDSKKVCKAYQEIADCYYIKTSVLCGNKAADIFKELVNAVIDSVITVDCSVSANVGSLRSQSNKNLVQNKEILNCCSTRKTLQTVVLIIGTFTITKLINHLF